MPMYNIAFVPEKESLESFISYAKTMAVKPAEYLLEKKSYPHVTICHFEANENEVADLIKKFTELEQASIELTFSTQRNKTYPTHPKWGQWSWVSLISNKLDELHKIHLKVASLVKPTNAAFQNYDPHLTLFNSYDHKACEKITSTVTVPLSANFNFVLGKLDEVGQITEIICDCTKKSLQQKNLDGNLIAKIGLHAEKSHLLSKPQNKEKTKELSVCLTK